MNSYLMNIYENIDLFLLIAMRLLGFFVVVPIFGGQTVPVMARIGFSLIIAAVIYSTQNVYPVSYADNVFGYGTLLAKEVMVGLIMGFCVYIIISIMYMVGQIIDYQIGFSMVSVMDPTSQIQVPITGNLLYFLICVLILCVNGHHVMIRALFYSYQMLPIGESIIVENAGIMVIFSNTVLTFFTLALKISLPVLGSILVLDAALGLLTKTAPQMNIFSVGTPVKLLVGLIIFMLITPIFISVSEMLIDEIYQLLFNMIKGMSPL